MDVQRTVIQVGHQRDRRFLKYFRKHGRHHLRQRLLQHLADTGVLQFFFAESLVDHRFASKGLTGPVLIVVPLV